MAARERIAYARAMVALDLRARGFEERHIAEVLGMPRPDLRQVISHERWVRFAAARHGLGDA